MNKSSGFSTHKLVICALFTVLSLTLFIIESMIPPIVPIPGFKIGLAYIPVVFVIYLGGNWKSTDGGLILLSRIILSSIFTSIFSLFFSFTGGIFSFVTIILFKKIIKERWGIVFCCIFSSIMHNIGQLLTASFIYSVSVWAYFPYLLVSAIATGTFTGLIVYFIYLRSSTVIKKIEKF